MISRNIIKLILLTITIFPYLLISADGLIDDKELSGNATFFIIILSCSLVLTIITLLYKYYQVYCLDKKLQSITRKNEILLTTFPSVLVELDLRNRVLFANDACYHVFGTNAKELIGNKFSPKIYKDDQSIVSIALNKVLSPPHHFDYYARVLTKAGWKQYHWKIWAVLNDKKQIEKIIKTGLNNTEKYLAEQQLRLMSQTLNSLNSKTQTNTMSNIVKLIKNCYSLDAVGIRLYSDELSLANPQGFNDNYLAEENKFCCTNAKKYCPCYYLLNQQNNSKYLDDNGAFLCNDLALFAKEQSKKSGKESLPFCLECGYASIALIPLSSAGKRIGFLQINDSRVNCFNSEQVSFLTSLAATIGIALTKQEALGAVEYSNAKYQALSENSRDGIIKFDLQKRIISMNPAAESIFSLDAEDLIGTRLLSTSLPDDLKSAWQIEINKVISSSLPCEKQSIIKTNWGDTIIKWRLLPEHDKDKKQCAVIAICQEHN